jgi:hypothetical protein
MKTILVPTDYQPSTFNCIPSLCQQLDKEDLTLIFMHMFKLSDSISELMLLNRRNREYEKVSDAFYERCNEAKAQYPQIKNVRIEFLYGSTLSLFKNFLEGNEVDAVLSPDDCSFTPIHKYSINPDVLVQKCGLPVIKVNHTRHKIKTATVAEPVYHDELLTEV